MGPAAGAAWTSLAPLFRANNTAWTRLANYAQCLTRIDFAIDEYDEHLDAARRVFVDSVRSWRCQDSQMLLAAGLVVTDLVVQGWCLRVRRGVVQVSPPAEHIGDRFAEKERVRRQELIRRDAQLRQSAAQKFIRSMEKTRVYEGRFVSIFSLMRDGRELADALRRARPHLNNGAADTLSKVIDPYLQFVASEDTTCPLTGLRLMDVWRYFRHTWTNQYTSAPGRSILFLVRDRVGPFHPVVGIGALASPIVQIRERDVWIGWHPDTFLAHITEEPTSAMAKWLVRVVDTAIAEIYFGDFLEDGILTSRHLVEPDDLVVNRLLQESVHQRRLHHRFARSQDLKSARSDLPGEEHWILRARTHLFRSKRALALASYLQARALLSTQFGGQPTGEKLRSLLATGQGRDVVRKLLKKAKGDRVGIAVADISVCGAVQPYNAILGGKLVAMLATSPEVVNEYCRRYSTAASEIASSMAGRAIVRPAKLVLLGTTSLYGVGSSQYNRIKIPCDRLKGQEGDALRYVELGHSEAFGTSQYSEESVQALVELVQQSANGQRVNSIFGEGVSPKLRKVREGLDLLGFPSDVLLRHYRRRVVYAVPLVRNVREYLLGLDGEADYFVPLQDGAQGTARVAEWWRARWLRGRICSDAVLEEVARHTLVRPVSHGARVVLSHSGNQRVLSPELS